MGVFIIHEDAGSCLDIHEFLFIKKMNKLPVDHHYHVGSTSAEKRRV